MPKPRKGERRDEFVSRAIPIIKKESPRQPHDQIVARAFSLWRQSKKQKKK